MSKKLLIETHAIKVSPSQLTENINKENGNLMVEGILATAEVKNGNGRYYKKELWDREMEKYDQIIKERADRINEAKEAERLRKVEARQKQKEIIDALQTMGIVFCIVAVLVIITALYFKAFSTAYAEGKIYNAPKDYTRKQKIQRGEIILRIMTTCRLMKQKVYKGKMACIYRGANKTYELEFTDIRVGCPKKYKCVLNPNGKEPNIDDIMESLRSIAK